VRPHRGDEAISLQFRDFTGNRLDREAKVIGYVEASERNVNLDRSHRIDPGLPCDVQQESGDPLIRSRPTKVDDVVVRGRHFAGNLGDKLRAKDPAPLDEFIEG
jgi:hypothetical protein